MKETAEKEARRIVDLYESAGISTETGIFPSYLEWKRLLESSHGGPILLCSFAKLKAGFSPEESSKTENEYSKANDRLMPLLGIKAHVATSGPFISQWIGNEDEDWDFIYITEFPSTEILVTFFTDEEYVRAGKVRLKFIEKQRAYVFFAFPWLPRASANG